MRLQWRTFGIPKRGHSAEEYEDACAGNPKIGRFAVADGAAESSYAREWARLLTGGFVHPEPKQPSERNWVDPLRKRWSAQIDHQPLPWYADLKRQQGAYATFLGLRLRPSKHRPEDGGIWWAVACGDCCLFHVRKGILMQAFPMTCSADFGNQPCLLRSRADPQSLVKNEQQRRGTWLAGDRFFLMTDAIGQWFLKEHEAERKPWRSITQLLSAANGHGDRLTWIEQLRDQGALRNDDVTVLFIHT